jgi:hypothetical protein
MLGKKKWCEISQCQLAISKLKKVSWSVESMKNIVSGCCVTRSRSYVEKRDVVSTGRRKQIFMESYRR